MYGNDFKYNFFEMRKIIEKHFTIIDEKLDPHTNVPMFLINKEPKSKDLVESFNDINQELDKIHLTGLLRRFEESNNYILQFEFDGEYDSKIILIIIPKKRETKEISSNKIHILLFLATLVSVIFAASLFILFDSPIYGGFDPYFNQIPVIFLIILYGLSILAILGLHEIGHLIACRSNDIEATYPYFIPLPIPPLGTMGAVIKQKTPPKNRNELFDVGISGPLVGFIISIVVISFGLALTRAIPTSDYVTLTVNHSTFLKQNWFFAFLENIGWASYPSTQFEAVDSIHLMLTGPDYFPMMLLVNVIESIFFPGFNPTSSSYLGTTDSFILPNQLLIMHPLAFAGYIGLLLTSLNMMTVGQLDGGHVSRSIFGDKKVKIAGKNIEVYKIVALFSLGLLAYVNFFFAIIALFLSRGLTHPGPQDDISPVSKSRKIAFIGFLCIILFSLPLGSMFLGISLILFGFAIFFYFIIGFIIICLVFLYRAK